MTYHEEVRSSYPCSRELRVEIRVVRQSWLLKPKYLVEGIIYEYEDEDEIEDHVKAKHVPKESIVATFEGNWRGEVIWKKVGDKVRLLSSTLSEQRC